MWHSVFMSASCFNFLCCKLASFASASIFVVPDEQFLHPQWFIILANNYRGTFWAQSLLFMVSFQEHWVLVCTEAQYYKVRINSVVSIDANITSVGLGLHYYRVAQSIGWWRQRCPEGKWNREWHFEIHFTVIAQISCTDYKFFGYGLAALVQSVNLITLTSFWEGILPPLSLSFGNKKILWCI